MNFSHKLVHLLKERFLLRVSPLKVFWKKKKKKKKNSSTLPERCLIINELKDAFFSLKMNKSTGADEICFNVVRSCFGELSDILRYVFDLSLQTGIFPDSLKIAKVTLYSKLVTLRKLVITV